MRLALPLLAFLTAGVAAEPGAAAYPREESRPGYVSDKVCAECHGLEADAWRKSKHSQAMQVARPETVLGNFDDQAFSTPAGNVTFHRENGRFTIHARGQDRREGKHPVAYTFGVHPLQQYLIPQSGGRLQAFTLAWDTVRNRWFDLQADEPSSPGEPLHWTGRYQNWNLMCAECHTTALRKRYDERTDTYRTTWAAAEVGCQACHGPGKVHVAAVRANHYRKLPGYGIPVAANQVDQCAACHARRTRLHDETVAGGEFLDHFQPDTLRPDLYYADGQQLAEVFEYGSFRQSRMYQAGVVCTDCHSAHGGKLLAAGNALCTRCHSENPNPAFPALRAGNYDSASHHFHVEGGRGSQCVDCHMPSKNYMVVHGRRDHAIRIPRPDLSARLNTPNACRQCHQDKDASWAAEVIRQHNGNRRYPVHYGEILTAARQGQPGALDRLARLAVDFSQPAIVRATATELFGYLGPERLPGDAVRDPDPAVRSVAAMVIGAWPAERAILMLGPLLDDPVRAVRIAAARSLAPFGEQALPSNWRRFQRHSLAEFSAAQQAMADMPAAQLNMATLYAQTGRSGLALEHYRRALQQDPAMLAVRLGMADLLSNAKRFKEAEQILRDGLASAADKAEVHTALGMLYFRQNEIDSATAEFQSALQLRPNDKKIAEILKFLQTR